MISIGGAQDPGNWETDMDPWPNGLGIFDMSALIWKMDYDNTAAPYEPSSLVADYYAGGERFPPNWGDPALQVIFNKTMANGTGGDDGTNPGNGDGTVGSDGSSNNTGAKAAGVAGGIAGGVIGGVAGLALITLVIWWLLRRKRKAQGTRQVVAPSEMESKPPTESYVYEMPQPQHLYELSGNGQGDAVHELPNNNEARRL